MTIEQKRTKLVGLFLFTLTIAFPPWSYVIPAWSTQCFVGYRLLLTPPKLKEPEQLRMMFSVYDSPGGSDVVARLEYIRLIMEWLGLSFIVAGVIQIRKENQSPFGIVLGTMVILIGSVLWASLLTLPPCHVA